MPRIQLQRINGNSYFCTERLSVGIIINPANNSAILIDSALDDSTAKAIDTLLKTANCSVAAIINTHSHADHCGGNSYFKQQYPTIKIYATDFEKPFIDNPYLEPYCLSSAAVPFREMRNKFLEAKPSVVTDIIPYADGSICVNDIQLSIFTLPGHTPGMIGIGNPADQVLYCGDAIFGHDTLNKHGVLFFANITDTKASLQKLLTLSGRYNWFLLYHGGMLNNLQALVAEHMEKLAATENFIYETIQTNPNISIEILLQLVMKQFNVPSDIVQYALTRTCVLAYLTNLQEQNKINVKVVDGLLIIASS
jgi:glyoxylase-like metal-dependent hydrolase (beta-lactamase superfamily II)